MRSSANRSIAVFALLLPLASSAIAMNEKEATVNIQYFAYAMKEAQLCDQLGFPGDATVKQWERKNGDVLVRSMNRIEEHIATKPDVSKEDAKDAPLQLFVRMKQRFDLEMAPRLGPRTCANFGEALRGYESKLVRD